MADNVTFQTTVATPPSGTIQRTDDLGAAGHVPYCKLMDGTDGASTVVAAGGGVEAGALRVTLANDSTGLVSVDDNAGSLTVDSPQLPAALAANGGMKVEGVAGGVAVPISAASLPLPSGAATAAKQPALGTAGTPSSDVLSMQGVSGGVAVKVDGSAVTQPVSGTFWQATQPVSGTVTVQDGGGSITVDGTVSVSGTVTVDTELPAAAALADGAANPTTPLTGSCALVWNGTTWDRLKGDTTNGAYVNVKAMIALPAGTNAIGKLAANSGVTIGAVELAASQTLATVTTVTTVTTVSTVTTLTGGGVAHDGVDSGNPVKVGGRAMTTARTAVADGDRADLATDVQGRVIVERDGPRELDTDACITLTSTTTETTLKAAVASTFLDLIDLIVINSSASATQVDFRDTTGGTVRFSLYVPAGATVGFSGQRWAQAAVNTNWTAQCGTSVASVKVSARFRKTK